jgi:hypothetical protein
VGDTAAVPEGRESQIIAAARFVADYWRQAMLASSESAWAAHPLCMVLAALDGETNPVQCGIDDSEWDGFYAAVTSGAAGASSATTEGEAPNDV